MFKKCHHCNKEVFNSNSCSAESPFLLSKKRFEIGVPANFPKFGNETYYNGEERCPGCGVAVGGHHHAGHCEYLQCSLCMKHSRDCECFKSKYSYEYTATIITNTFEEGMKKLLNSSFAILDSLLYANEPVEKLSFKEVRDRFKYNYDNSIEDEYLPPVTFEEYEKLFDGYEYGFMYTTATLQNTIHCVKLNNKYIIIWKTISDHNPYSSKACGVMMRDWEIVQVRKYDPMYHYFIRPQDSIEEKRLKNGDDELFDIMNDIMSAHKMRLKIKELPFYRKGNLKLENGKELNEWLEAIGEDSRLGKYKIVWEVENGFYSTYEPVAILYSDERNWINSLIIEDKEFEKLIID